MIAFPGMLVEPAKKAGIKVPEDPDNYEPMDFVKFYVLCKVQLGQPMPSPTSHWENAEVIAAISDEKIKTVTYQELLDFGWAAGYACP